MSKMNKIHCSSNIKNILCEALRNYTSYPTSNIDRHHDMFFIIKHIDDDFNKIDNTTYINPDLQDFYHLAINHHYDNLQQQLNISVDGQRDLMLQMLDGKLTHDTHLDTALYKDKII